VNHVSLDGRGDVDHVLVGPAGVLVVETKWTAAVWDISKPEPALLKGLQYVEDRARQFTRWHEIKRHGGLEAVPVLVVWTQANPRRQPVLDPTVRVQDHAARIVWGPDLAAWTLRMGRSRLTAVQVDDIW
jgi:hypothetical protein